MFCTTFYWLLQFLCRAKVAALTLTVCKTCCTRLGRMITSAWNTGWETAVSGFAAAANEDVKQDPK